MEGSIFLPSQGLAVQNVHCAPILSTDRVQNSTSATDPTEAPAPIPTGETLLVETSEGDFEIVTRSHYPKIIHQNSYNAKQNSISSADLESIVRKLVEKIQLDSLQEEQQMDSTLQDAWSNMRQLATLIPEPTTSGPSDLLLFPSPEQLGPNAARVPLKDSKSFSQGRTIELQIHIGSNDNIRVALPTAVLASPVEALPTDVPVPTEIPPPFSQVGSNQPFYFLGPPTVFEPNQTQSSRVLDKDELSKQIGYLVLDQVLEYLSRKEEPYDDFEKYIIGKNSYKISKERLVDATEAPLPAQSSQPKQGTTLPLSLSNLPPPPAVVLPNGSLS
ncbi:hypothetical protein Gasu2_14860 [Galdieria sulphuraria]|nr:hypothetical protein Gasu2_14860 [Galdieria sulphuraria]